MVDNKETEVKDKPDDGVIVDTQCVLTKFRGAKMRSQKGPNEAHISASFELGTVSIRDMVTGTMLTVNLEVMMETIMASINHHKDIEMAKEKIDGGPECLKEETKEKETLENVEDAESKFCSSEWNPES